MAHLKSTIATPDKGRATSAVGHVGTYVARNCADILVNVRFVSRDATTRTRSSCGAMGHFGDRPLRACMQAW